MPSSRSGLRVDTNKKNDTAYADALRNHNVAVDVTIAPGLAHNILLEPIAMERVKDIAGAMLCFALPCSWRRRWYCWRCRSVPRSLCSRLMDHVTH
jgi:hypothetical protein